MTENPTVKLKKLREMSGLTGVFEPASSGMSVFENRPISG
jgi:hypothetical protein